MSDSEEEITITETLHSKGEKPTCPKTKRQKLHDSLDLSDQKPTLSQLKVWLNDGRAHSVPNPKGKSDVWGKFELVLDSSDKFLRFAQCVACKMVYSYDLGGPTTSLSRHVCEKKPASSILGYLEKPRVNVAAKLEITAACTKYVCRDLRPFESVSQDGLRQLIDTAMNVALKWGKQPINELLPDPTTVSRNVGKTAAEYRDKVGPTVRTCLLKSGGAITLDLWTEDYTKTSYLGVTAHYVIENKLVDCVLFVTEYTLEDKKAVNVRKFLLERLAQFGIKPEDLPDTVFVSDEGSNVVNAVTAKDMRDQIPFKHRACSGHILNTVLRNTFASKSNPLPQTAWPAVDILDKTKALVTHFKQTGLMKQLTTTLKQECETRWNSKYRMLQSLLREYENVRAILRTREDNGEKGTELLPGPKRMVDDLAQLLKFFYDATKELSMSKEPSLQKCVPWFYILRDELEKFTSEYVAVNIIAKRALEFLQKKLVLHDIEKIACFLDPFKKSLNMYTKSEKDAIHSIVRKSLPTPACAMELDLSSSIVGSGSVYDRFEQQPTEASDELSSYLLSPIPSKSVKLLDYWISEKDRFPGLSALALKVFAVPATSTPSERAFSLSGFLVDARRTSLKPDKVDDVLFLHSHMK